MIKENSIQSEDDEYLSAAEAASLLGIHTASIRNWIRHGYIHPVNSSPQVIFTKSEIKELKKNIDAGKIERLNKRANKSKAKRTFIPDEYSGNQEISEAVQHIADYIAEGHLDINTSLFLLCMNLAGKLGLAHISLDKKPGSIVIESSNPYLQEELKSWLQCIHENSGNNSYKELLNINIPSEEDILGLIYQSVLAEGRKAKMGSYYTPRKVVASIMKEYMRTGLRFLDPCCGTGRFLLCAASITDDPENIVGFDIDELAVRIARINIIFKFPNKQFNPQIFCYDTLNRLPDKFKNSFDVIASNPPWGMHFNSYEVSRLVKKYPEITSGESFSYFIRTAYDLSREGGTISFILPEALLNVRTHKDIRKFILDNTNIGSVYIYDNIFKNVFTKVIRLDMTKVPVYIRVGNNEKLNPDHQINIYHDSNNYYSSQNSFYNNHDLTFSFHSNDHSRNILEKVYGVEHTSLKKQAQWALGIVTGDNKKFISSVQSEGFEKVFTGKEVARYKLKETSNYIKFLPAQFQQVAQIQRYRAKEKLIYKFISKYLVFAYDDKQCLTLNSANILIPEVPDYPIKTILALLNSSLYQFIFHQKFNSIKVLRSHLEALPLPILEEKVHAEICELADNILNGEDKTEEIDNYILNLFGLSTEEIDYLK